MKLNDLFLFDVTPREVLEALRQNDIWNKPVLTHSLERPYVTLSVVTDDRGRKDTTIIARIGGQDGIDEMQEFLRSIDQPVAAEALEAHRTQLPQMTPQWFIGWRNPPHVALYGWEPHVHRDAKIIVGGVRLTSTFYVVRMD